VPKPYARHSGMSYLYLCRKGPGKQAAGLCTGRSWKTTLVCSSLSVCLWSCSLSREIVLVSRSMHASRNPPTSSVTCNWRPSAAATDQTTSTHGSSSTSLCPVALSVHVDAGSWGSPSVHVDGDRGGCTSRAAVDNPLCSCDFMNLLTKFIIIIN